MIRFNHGGGIPFCIAMAESEETNFNSIMRQIIKKSLFTERQIEIILHRKGLAESKFSITKGAYYRQVGQSRDKLASLFYSIVLLRGLGVLLPDDIDVISELSGHIRVINESYIPPGNEEQITDVMEAAIRQVCNM